MNQKTTKTGAGAKTVSKRVPQASQPVRSSANVSAATINIYYPNNDQVLVSFAAYGTTDDDAISTVIVSQGGVPLNIMYAVLRQPPPGGGTWIISIDMPTGSAGPFVLTVSTSSGAIDTKPFSI